MKKTNAIVPVGDKQMNQLKSENQQLKKQLEILEKALDSAEEKAYIAGYEDAILEEERKSQALNVYLSQAVEIFEKEYRNCCMNQECSHSRKNPPKSKKK